MLTVNVQKLLYAKGIEQPYKWMVKAGITRSMAQKLMKGNIRSLPLDVAEIICLQAWCSLNDLLTWEPDAPERDVPNHPLQKLKPKTQSVVIDRLKMLTPEQLAKLDGMIDELEKG